MLVQLLSAALRGVDAYLVRVEVHVASGLPSFTVVGLPQGAVREGRERVSAALQETGLSVPLKRITVNLAPADVRKEGSAFDLALALGLAADLGVVAPERLEGLVVLGELGLDGRVRPVRGAVAVAAVARREGIARLVVPAENAGEAAVVEGVEVLAVRSLRELLAHLDGGPALEPVRVDTSDLLRPRAGRGPDLADVRGQLQARRALEVAAAGGHNLLLTGPPGVGKTMLARRLPGILPPLELEEALEVTRVHSVAGLLASGEPLVRERPFRAPHHTISDAGLVGGGSPPRPGEVSLAHHGVLFLDELPEFRRHVLEALRQPVEDGRVTIARARQTVCFPARVVLVAAMNPCPCGHWGDGSERCTCDPAHVARYRARISGPVLDRLDLRVEVPRVPVERLAAEGGGEPTEAVRGRVLAARARQRERLAGEPGVFANGQMAGGTVRKAAPLSREARRLLVAGARTLGVSARGYDRLLRVARTVADLDGEERLGAAHVAEALQYRGGDAA